MLAITYEWRCSCYDVVDKVPTLSDTEANLAFIMTTSTTEFLDRENAMESTK